MNAATTTKSARTRVRARLVAGAFVALCALGAAFAWHRHAGEQRADGGARDASRGAAALLRRVGVAVHEIPVTADLAAARAAIRDLARRLDAVARGEAMIAALEERMDALPRPIAPARAVSLHAGGWVAGAGSLANALFARLGFVNAGAARAGFVQMDVETLLYQAPDLIVVERHGGPAASRMAESMTHPALARGPARRVEVPARDWACADEGLAQAAALIAGAGR